MKYCDKRPTGGFKCVATCCNDVRVPSSSYPEIHNKMFLGITSHQRTRCTDCADLCQRQQTVNLSEMILMPIPNGSIWPPQRAEEARLLRVYLSWEYRYLLFGSQGSRIQSIKSPDCNGFGSCRQKETCKTVLKDGTAEVNWNHFLSNENQLRKQLLMTLPRANTTSYTDHYSLCGWPSRDLFFSPSILYILIETHLSLNHSRETEAAIYCEGFTSLFLHHDVHETLAQQVGTQYHVFIIRKH